jgi:hypothetical protein
LFPRAANFAAKKVAEISLASTTKLEQPWVRFRLRSQSNLSALVRAMPQTPMLQAALAYARSGYAVFPVPRGTKMSFKSAARNGGVRWGATRDQTEIARDFERWPTANIGIPTGKENKFWVMELDTAAHGVDGAATLAALVAAYGPLPLTRQALSPSGSRHFYFVYPPSLVIRNDTARKLGSGIDIRGDGGMVVAPPSERDDGIYTWVNAANIANAPQWLLELVHTPQFERRAQFNHDDDNAVVHADLVAAAMAHVPTRLTWHERNNIGMAIFTATGGSQAGFVIWDNWLRRSGKYDARSTAARWAAMGRSPPTDIGYGTLSYLATQADAKWLTELDKQLIATMNEGNNRWKEHHP